MSQNTTHAVMQQRAEPHDSLDDFPTPPWATRALIEHVIRPHSFPGVIRMASCWEPACNRGHMVVPLTEYFGVVFPSDIHDYGMGYPQHDFLMPYSPAERFGPFDWIITNPPFSLAEQFIERARGINGWQGTAVLVRTSFLEGVGRYERLYRDNPPTLVAQFVERVPMVKGHLSAESVTATSYCWLVWMKDRKPQPIIWIPPCRKKLERSGDYPQLPDIGG
jgi:hypothetical protein